MNPFLYKINIKSKTNSEVGLPKKSVQSSKISSLGLEKDFNRFRTTKKANDPDMAIMLLSMDILDNLNKEGWPVKPGDLGENLTLKNINYSTLKPNQKYAIGSVEIQISFICSPCNNLKYLKYVGDSKKDRFIKTLLNRRGWYARVLKEGKINTGDIFESIF